VTDWQRISDEDLVIKGSLGPSDQGASSNEMLRRLKGTNVELRIAIDDLKTTLHREEVAIKNLTLWLVGMTVALVVLTCVLVWRAFL
jgi:hypothetical protein